MGGRGWPAALALILGIAGCTTKEDRALFETIQNRSERLRAVQQSEEIVFYPGTEEESILIATYLPQESGREGEVFILACAPPDRLHPRSFTLAGKRALKIERISRRRLSSALQGSIPSWFAVYRVLYPAVEGKKFALSYADGAEKGKKDSRFFYKGPKYLVEKRSFGY